MLSSIISTPSISLSLVSHLLLSLDTMQNLVHLFQNAIQSEYEVILSWFYYSISFENRVDEIRYDTGVSNKTARSQIYQEILEHLLNIILGNLHMRTL